MAVHCVKCDKTVRRNQHALECDKCQSWTHRTCGTEITREEYLRLCNTGEDFDFMCFQCEALVASFDTDMLPDFNIELNSTLEAPDLSMNNSDAVQEVSMEEDIMAEDQTEEIPPYTLVEDGSQKSKPKLVDRNGFTYVTKEVTQKKTYYRCSKRPCKATVVECKETGERQPGKHIHSHTAEAGKLFSVQVRAQTYNTFEEDSTGPGHSHEEEVIFKTVPEKESPKPLRERQDVFMWLGGVAFIVILIGAIFGIGQARNWDAQSGYTHNTSATSRERFLPEPFVPEPGVKGRYGVEADSRWYYWKLPPDRVTPYTRLFAWLCYIGHQTLAWVVLYLAQYHKSSLPKPERYSTRLTKWNYIAFGLHVFFHLLHLVQTHTTYDALAQDTSIASSQGSVIMILVFILLIEYRDRGIVFMWPTNHNQDKLSRKLRLDQSAFAFIRRYHGYAFAWGAIYTFWYHPMENTWGHALGFFHTWIIMLQGTLAYTDFHLNKYWRFLLEAWVTLHGTLVAIQTGGPEQLGTRLWPMFTFGFAFMIVFTQAFGLPFWKRIHWSFRVIPLVVYLAVAVYMYSWIPDKDGRTFVRMQEILRIPAAYYLGFVYAWLLFYVFLRLERKIWGQTISLSPLKTLMCLIAVYAIFTIFVGLSACVQAFDLQVGLILLMIVFVFIFITGVCISCMLLNLTIPQVAASIKD